MERGTYIAQRGGQFLVPRSSHVVDSRDPRRPMERMVGPHPCLGRAEINIRHEVARVARKHQSGKRALIGRIGCLVRPTKCADGKCPLMEPSREQDPLFWSAKQISISLDGQGLLRADLDLAGSQRSVGWPLVLCPPSINNCSKHVCVGFGD